MQQYFGIWADFGFALFGLSALVYAVGSVWLRAKRMSKDDHGRAMEASTIERLSRIEQIVEGSALEIERMTEMQRHASRLLAERSSSGLPERSSGRIFTPH